MYTQARHAGHIRAQTVGVLVIGTVKVGHAVRWQGPTIVRALMRLD